MFIPTHLWWSSLRCPLVSRTAWWMWSSFWSPWDEADLEGLNMCVHQKPLDNSDFSFVSCYPSYLAPAGSALFHQCPSYCWRHTCSTQNPQLSPSWWRSCRFRGCCAFRRWWPGLGSRWWDTRTAVTFPSIYACNLLPIGNLWNLATCVWPWGFSFSYLFTFPSSIWL